MMNKTPIYYSLESYYNHSEDLTKILISNGANINTKDIIYLNIKILFLIKII